MVGIVFGAVAVGLAAIADVISTSSMGADTPAWIHSLWMFIVPVIVGALKGAANWLKNKDLKTDG